MGSVHLTDNALTVLQKRYLKRDLEGNVVETPEDMFRRVARNLAQADRLYDPQANLDATSEEFYGLMTSLDFMPTPHAHECGKRASTTLGLFVLPS